MTPRQARAARAMLGLDMKTVCKLASVGKRTLTEFEAGARSISESTKNKIKAFYLSEGVLFPTQEGREGVEIKSFEGHYNKPIYEKSEYIDLFNITSINEDMLCVSKKLDQMESKISISQNILLYAQKKYGLNQKDIAQYLELSNSFISAIAVGRKLIPLSHSEKIQKFFDQENINVKKALNNEKILFRLSRQMKEFQEKYSNAWRSIY